MQVAVTSAGKDTRGKVVAYRIGRRGVTGVGGDADGEDDVGTLDLDRSGESPEFLTDVADVSALTADGEVPLEGPD